MQTKMSLVTAGTDCMVSQHLWDVVVNCSIARDRQLQKVCHQRCVCACRLHSPAKAGSELKSITERFGVDQDYEKAYRRLITAVCMAPHIASKSKQQMASLKEHVTDYYLTSVEWSA